MRKSEIRSEADWYERKEGEDKMHTQERTQGVGRRT